MNTEPLQVVGAVDIPAVCLVEDLCRILRVSRRNLQRLRHGRSQRALDFQKYLPEIPSLDARPRWAGVKVRAFLDRQQQPERRTWRRTA